MIAAWCCRKKLNLATPPGSYPTSNHRLVVTTFSTASEQAAEGVPWNRARKGCGQCGRDGVLQEGPGSGKPVAFRDPCDRGHTERLSFEEWPGSVRAIGGGRERSRCLVRGLRAGSAQCTPRMGRPVQAGVTGMSSGFRRTHC